MFLLLQKDSGREATFSLLNLTVWESLDLYGALRTHQPGITVSDKNVLIVRGKLYHPPSLE